MDGRQFDSLTRAFAGQSTRRLLLRRGAALSGAIASLAAVGSTSAARRGGNNGSTSICSPDGLGGYYRTSVPTILLSTYLNSGSIISDCCSHADCGPTNGCITSTCDFQAGSCSVTSFNGATCARAGCADGVCIDGVCSDPTPMYCAGDGYCNSCVYDACNHHCDCHVKPCYPEDWQCQDAWCDPGQAACVLDPINDGSPCDTFGQPGVCVNGYCTSA